VSFQEPCGMSIAECCHHATVFGQGVNSFEIDDSGCCLISRLSPDSRQVPYNGRVGYLTSLAGSGLV
jgi:hypothetical protein